MSRVGTALVTAHDVRVLGEEVDDLAFPFVPPLRADDDCCGHLFYVQRRRVGSAQWETHARAKPACPPMRRPASGHVGAPTMTVAGTARSLGTAQEFGRSGVLSCGGGEGRKLVYHRGRGRARRRPVSAPFLSAAQDSRECGVLAFDGWIPRSPVSPAQRGDGQTASPSPRRRHRKKSRLSGVFLYGWGRGAVARTPPATSHQAAATPVSPAPSRSTRTACPRRHRNVP